MIDDFFKDERAAKVIRAILRSKGVTGEDLRDAVQDVYEALVVWARRKGAETAEELGAGAGAIAKNLGTKYWRTVATRGKHNAGATDQADEHGPPANPTAVDLVDIRNILDEINAMRESGTLSEKAAAVLRALAQDTSLAEHANETGQSPDAVRQTAVRAKREVIEHLAQRGLIDVGLSKLLSRQGALVAAAVAIIFLLIFSDRLRSFLNEPVAHDPDHHSTREDAGAPMIQRESQEAFAARTQERQESAARLQLRAELAYKRMEWRNCVQRLDEAKNIDPSFDEPELRNECLREEEVDSNSKTPRRPR